MAIETINELHERGVNIKSLTEPDIDTTTPMGRALFGIVAVFAQLRVDTPSARACARPRRVLSRIAVRMRDEGRSLAHIATASSEDARPR